MRLLLPVAARLCPCHQKSSRGSGRCWTGTAVLMKDASLISPPKRLSLAHSKSLPRRASGIRSRRSRRAALWRRTRRTRRWWRASPRGEKDMDVLSTFTHYSDGTTDWLQASQFIDGDGRTNISWLDFAAEADLQ